jgi:hypothetical protein
VDTHDPNSAEVPELIEAAYGLDTVRVPEPVEVAFEADPVLAAAVDLARAAARAESEAVGDHLGVTAEADRVVTHAFASSLRGYAGWYWAVTVARVEDSIEVTVDEVVLLPGAEALLAPAWVPWHERLRPGDLGPGDLMPPPENDVRLAPAYLDSDDPAVADVGFEVGLGRERVMSREGRLEAAQRWQDGDCGPETPMARQAPARCGTCGFFVSLAGVLSAAFGVCANEISPSDGRVVSVGYGCGAHSDTRVEGPSPAEPVGEIFDDGEEITANPVATG